MDPAQLINVTLALGKVGPNTLEFVAGKGAENANVATMNRPVIGDACDCGPVTITATPKWFIGLISWIKP